MKKAWRHLHKNAKGCFEQLLEVTPTKKMAAVRASTSHHKKTIQMRRTQPAGHCWGSTDELISNVLLWTSSHGYASFGKSARTYLGEICVDTGCSLGAMDNRDGRRERVREIHTSSTTWWWWNHQMDYYSNGTDFTKIGKTKRTIPEGIFLRGEIAMVKLNVFTEFLV